MTDQRPPTDADGSAPATAGMAVPEPPTPEPLGSPMGREPAFPFDALGPVGQPAAEAVQEVTQAPRTLCAQSALFAMAAATQAHANVRMPHDVVLPLSQYLVAIGESSERKSTVVRHLTQFLSQQDENLRSTFEKEFAEWRKSQSENDGNDAPPPLRPEIIAQEPTYEGLLKTLDQGPGCAVLLNDDAGDVVSGHALSAENRLKTSAGLSRLWSGDPIIRPRTGGDVLVRHKRFSLFLMLQGQAAQRLLSDELLNDQGLLSRILVTYPASTIGTRLFRLPSQSAQSALETFNDQMLAILSRPMHYRESGRNELNPRELVLSAGARDAWIPFYNTVERESAPGKKYHELRAFAGKMPEQVGRLAGILTLVEDVTASEIPESAMESAIRIGEFYLAEKKRLVQLSDADPATDCAREILTWLQQTWPCHYISRPDIQQSGPNHLRKNRNLLTEAIELLLQKGWLRPVDGGATVRGRKRREAWEIVKS